MNIFEYWYNFEVKSIFYPINCNFFHIFSGTFGRKDGISYGKQKNFPVVAFANFLCLGFPFGPLWVSGDFGEVFAEIGFVLEGMKMMECDGYT